MMRSCGTIEFGGLLLAPLLVPLLVLGSAGCDQLERLPSDPGTAGLPRAVDQALTRSCATDGACHLPGNGIVVLTGASLPALEDGGYVRRGDLEGSTLAVKMLGLPGITGGLMPPATHPADPDDLALILAWLAGLDPGDAGTSGSDGGAITTGEPLDCLQGQSLGTPPRFAELWPMLEATCSVSASCHSGMQSPAMPDEATAYTSLVGATSLFGLALVVPGSPDDSYAWHKLIGTQMAFGGVGGRMPVGEPLCDEGLAGMYAWILAGAPE